MSRQNITGKKILFAVLDWGLGHASHSIPLIKNLSEHNEVIIATGGSAALFLQTEFPELRLIDFPGFSIKYVKNRYLLVPSLIIQLPKMLFSTWWEMIRLKSVIRKFKIDLIFSNNRYGMISNDVPSFFITHQLRFKLPRFLKRFEIISEWFNWIFFNKFSAVFVLDVPGQNNIAGDLTHKGKITQHKKVHYVGLWSSLVKEEKNTDIDVLAIISGPAPNRHFFAEKVIDQLKQVKGKRVVVLGNPSLAGKDYVEEGIKVYQFQDRKSVNDLINRAKIVICRPGYASTMDMIKLKKTALMIPTPGQTEQEYQAEYYRQNGYFYSVSEGLMNLSDDIDICRQQGFSAPSIMMNNQETINEIVTKYIE